MKLTHNKFIALCLLGTLQSSAVFAEDLASILRYSLQQDPALVEAKVLTMT